MQLLCASPILNTHVTVSGYGMYHISICCLAGSQWLLYAMVYLVVKRMFCLVSASCAIQAANLPLPVVVAIALFFFSFGE